MLGTALYCALFAVSTAFAQRTSVVQPVVVGAPVGGVASALHIQPSASSLAPAPSLVPLGIQPLTPWPRPPAGSAPAPKMGPVFTTNPAAQRLATGKSPWKPEKLDELFDGSGPKEVATEDIWERLERRAFEYSGTLASPEPGALRRETARALRDNPGLELDQALAGGFARAYSATPEQRARAATVMTPYLSFETVLTGVTPLVAAWHQDQLWFATTDSVYAVKDGQAFWRRHGASTGLATIDGRLYLSAGDGLWRQSGDSWEQVVGHYLRNPLKAAPLDHAGWVGESNGRVFVSMDTGLWSGAPDAPKEKKGWLETIRDKFFRRGFATQVTHKGTWRLEVSGGPFHGVEYFAGRHYASGPNGVWAKNRSDWKLIHANPSTNASYALKAHGGALYASMPRKLMMGAVAVLRGGEWTLEEVPTVGPVSSFVVLDDTLLAVCPDGVFARNEKGAWVRVLPRQNTVINQVLRTEDGDLVVGAGFILRIVAGAEGVPPDWSDRLANDLGSEIERLQAEDSTRKAGRAGADDLTDDSGRSLFGD